MNLLQIPIHPYSVERDSIFCDEQGRLAPTATSVLAYFTKMKDFLAHRHLPINYYSHPEVFGRNGSTDIAQSRPNNSRDIHRRSNGVSPSSLPGGSSVTYPRSIAITISRPAESRCARTIREARRARQTLLSMLFRRVVR